MKKKIEEKTAEFKLILEQINSGRSQMSKLEQEALMIQGELRLLKELEQEKA